MCIKTVSYTHLDVYKRQEHNCAPIALVVANIEQTYILMWFKTGISESHEIFKENNSGASSTKLFL